MENKEKGNYLLLIKKELPQVLLEEIKVKIREYRNDIIVVSGENIEFHKLDINNERTER